MRPGLYSAFVRPFDKLYYFILCYIILFVCYIIPYYNLEKKSKVFY